MGDLDQIDGDLQAGKGEALMKQNVDFDKPGLAQFYCVHCAKHFINGDAFKSHVKGKPHKRRLHALETEPYTVEESLRASGMGSYIQPAQRKMTTLIPEAVTKGESLADIKKRAKMEAGELAEESMPEDISRKQRWKMRMVTFTCNNKIFIIISLLCTLL